MSKRKYWIAYCVLTVLAAVLLAFMPRYSTYLQAYGGRHYNYMPYIVVTMIVFPVLWGLLLSFRSRCFRKAVTKAAHLIPEVLMILLALDCTLRIAFQGMIFMPMKTYIQPFIGIFPAVFAGTALADILAGIRSTGKEEKESVISEEKE